MDFKNKKIAILTPTFYQYSGIDRVAEEQAEDLAKKGNKVTVFTLESTKKPKGYKIVEIGMPKSLFKQRIYRLLFFLDKKKIRRYAKQIGDYDVAISHLYPMNILASETKKLYNVEYIFYNHGIGFPKLFTNIFENIYMRLFIFFSNISLKNVDKSYSISRFMQSELKRESKLNSKIIYNKIDKRFNKNAKGNKIIKKYDLKNKKILLFVGRLSPHKGVHLLLKSFDIIKNKVPNSKLLIIGKPTFNNYFKTLKKLANKDVVFIGFVPDKELPYYYAACNLYVTASLWEGFDLPAAEAQACGKKVVAFNVCSHPEIVKNGILVREKDIRGFANAVVRLLNKK